MDKEKARIIEQLINHKGFEYIKEIKERQKQTIIDAPEEKIVREQIKYHALRDLINELENIVKNILHNKNNN